MQVHFTGWPDHGVPKNEAAIDSFEKMLEICLMQLLAGDATNERMVIHCSAGVGRTGTTAALMHLITNLWAQRNAGISDPLISVFSTVRRLREQRFYAVQVPEQYEFIFKFLQFFLAKYKF